MLGGAAPEQVGGPALLVHEGRQLLDDVLGAVVGESAQRQTRGHQDESQEPPPASRQIANRKSPIANHKSQITASIFHEQKRVDEEVRAVEVGVVSLDGEDV